MHLVHLGRQLKAFHRSQVMHQMHHHYQLFSSISQSELSSSVVCCSHYEARIDIWTMKNEKIAKFDDKCIFRKFWKYWITCLLAYSNHWGVPSSFYKLRLHKLISNPMWILILRYTDWYFRKNILQNSPNFILKFNWNNKII